LKKEMNKQITWVFVCGDVQKFHPWVFIVIDGLADFQGTGFFLAAISHRIQLQYKKKHKIKDFDIITIFFKIDQPYQKIKLYIWTCAHCRAEEPIAPIPQKWHELKVSFSALKQCDSYSDFHQFPTKEMD
jgi:hypothetical protein